MKLYSKLCQLLPWFINGTLDAKQMEAMNTHIKECDECARDFETSMQFSRALQVPPEGVEELQSQQSFGFSQLQQKIAEQDRKTSRKAGGSVKARLTHFLSGYSQWLFGSACGAVATMLLVFVIYPSGTGGPDGLPASIDPAGGENFVLLTNSQTSSYPVVQVIFEEQTSESDVREFLADYQLSVIGNPSSTGVYRLHLRNVDEIEQQLSKINALAQIRWAAIE